MTRTNGFEFELQMNESKVNADGISDIDSELISNFDEILTFYRFLGVVLYYFPVSTLFSK